jgi:hypothetical protein
MRKIEFAALFDGRLEKFGVEELGNPDTTSYSKCLTDDGGNCLWINCGEDGSVAVMTCYFLNGDPSKILCRIQEALNTKIVSEYEPEYWGFDSEAEWKTRLRELKWQEDQFFVDLLKFIANEPNGIRAGTNDETTAKIAKRLVEVDPTLVLPAKRQRLKELITEVRDRDLLIKVKQTDQDPDTADENIPF